jgi:pyruvate dehydrogenase E1 component beta subunit
MSGGQLTVPLTVRVQGGISGNMGAHHSQSLEAWLAHVPGLKVVMPATAADAKALLKAAIRDQNPVVFVEHRALYRSRGEVSDEPVPLGQASVARQGRHATIVAVSRMVQDALEAAGDLENDGISAEVVDLRSIAPLDLETIVASVKKTGRLIIAHEAVEYGGIGAEIAARVQKEVFYYLDGPVVRVAAPFAPVPASPSLEKCFLPAKNEIVRAVKQLLAKE